MTTFALCDTPLTVRKPITRDRKCLIAALLSKPQWSSRDPVRLNRILDKFEFDRHDTEAEEIYFDATGQLNDWHNLEKRIAEAAKHSTAQYKRQSRLPHRNIRVADLFDKIEMKRQSRDAIIRPTMKDRKTWKARSNEFDRVFGRDPIYSRLMLRRAQLYRYAPNAGQVSSLRQRGFNIGSDSPDYYAQRTN